MRGLGSKWYADRVVSVQNRRRGTAQLALHRKAGERGVGQLYTITVSPVSPDAGIAPTRCTTC
jgi:hypothetical protein